jgi:hypothetical protein
MDKMEKQKGGREIIYHWKKRKNINNLFSTGVLLQKKNTNYLLNKWSIFKKKKTLKMKFVFK